nr:uncharacterized protein LOC129524495 [Gorilla gorilla gorilla]
MRFLEVNALYQKNSMQVKDVAVEESRTGNQDMALLMEGCDHPVIYSRRAGAAYIRKVAYSQGALTSQGYSPLFSILPWGAKGDKCSFLHPPTPTRKGESYAPDLKPPQASDLKPPQASDLKPPQAPDLKLPRNPTPPLASRLSASCWCSPSFPSNLGSPSRLPSHRAVEAMTPAPRENARDGSLGTAQRRVKGKTVSDLPGPLCLKPLNKTSFHPYLQQSFPLQIHSCFYGFAYKNSLILVKTW